MKAELFCALEEALNKNATCAIVTDIEDGQQVLLQDSEVIGSLCMTADQLVSARKMMKEYLSGTIDDTNLFVRAYAPPLRMIVVGAAHIAQALVPMAQLAGFDVVVVDPRDSFVEASHLSDLRPVVDWPDDAMMALAPDNRTAVVTLTHDPKLDDPALVVALKSPAFYLGSLGSTRTHAKRLQRLKENGFSEKDLGRIYGPVGLNIKAKTPSEIAVAILAQVIEVWRKL